MTPSVPTSAKVVPAGAAVGTAPTTTSDNASSSAARTRDTSTAARDVHVVYVCGRSLRTTGAAASNPRATLDSSVESGDSDSDPDISYPSDDDDDYALAQVSTSMATMGFECVFFFRPRDFF